MNAKLFKRSEQLFSKPITQQADLGSLILKVNVCVEHIAEATLS